jgi:hypothetical protein
MSHEEVLRKIIVDVLRELNGAVVDFYNASQLANLEHIIEEKVKQRMGGMCQKVFAYLEWGEEPEWMHLDVDCDETSAHVAIPVYATIITNEIEPSDVDIEAE